MLFKLTDMAIEDIYDAGFHDLHVLTCQLFPGIPLPLRSRHDFGDEPLFFMPYMAFSLLNIEITPLLFLVIYKLIIITDCVSVHALVSAITQRRHSIPNVTLNP